MKYFFVYILLLFSLPASSANVVKQAKENIKKRQKLEQTEKDLLAEAAKPTLRQRQRIECFVLAAECCKRINEAENEKLYLKQPYDTVKFFSSLRDMFVCIMKADSVSSLPNEKGVIKRTNPERYRDLLWPYRSNLLRGGKWYYRKGQLQTAYDYFDLYISTAKSPIFLRDNLLTTDAEVPMTAYLAVFSAQKENNHDGVIKHSDLAKLAGQKSYLVQEYYVRALQAKSDTARYLSALHQGLEQYPDHHFFFTHLMDYYAASRQPERGLALCNTLLHEHDTVPLFWYAKSSMLLRLHRDRDAIDACDSCLRLDPNYADAYYNKGVASLNLAVAYTEQACTDVTNPRCRRDLEIIRSLYMLAKQPMEKLRQLEPEASQRWAAPLYRIYLNLNMGDEFDEMDRILNQQNPNK